MPLQDRIDAELRSAIKARDAARVSTLRLISAAMKDRAIATRGAGSAGGGDNDAGVSDADALEVLTRMVKQRKDSARAFEEAGRLELAEKERAEIGVVEQFLPRQMSDAEIAAAIDAEVAAQGADSIRDMGRVMGALKARYAGRMDFGVVGPQVRARLS